MTYPKRSPVLIGALIMLLAACGSTASSSTPAASSATPAATAAPLVRGEFVSRWGSANGIALSTNGTQVVAYLCNGTFKHVTLEQWFKGPVTGNHINITNAAGTRLAATVTAQAITGTATLTNGHSWTFTAYLVPTSAVNTGHGLFRSEETFDGVSYLGGWVFPVTASLTSAVFPVMVGPLPEWGGIIDVKTSALIASPPVDAANPFRVTVPDVGTFVLTQCLQAQC